MDHWSLGSLLLLNLFVHPPADPLCKESCSLPRLVLRVCSNSPSPPRRLAPASSHSDQRVGLSLTLISLLFVVCWMARVKLFVARRLWWCGVCQERTPVHLVFLCVFRYLCFCQRRELATLYDEVQPRTRGVASPRARRAREPREPGEPASGVAPAHTFCSTHGSHNTM